MSATKNKKTRKVTPKKGPETTPTEPPADQKQTDEPEADAQDTAELNENDGGAGENQPITHDDGGAGENQPITHDDGGAGDTDSGTEPTRRDQIQCPRCKKFGCPARHGISTRGYKRIAHRECSHCQHRFTTSQHVKGGVWNVEP